MRERFTPIQEKPILERAREGWHKLPKSLRIAVLAGLLSCASFPETGGHRALSNKEIKTKKSPDKSAAESCEEELKIDRRSVAEIYKDDFAPYKRFQTKKGARQLEERLQARLKAGGDDLNKTRYGDQDYFLKKEYRFFVGGNENIEEARENEELRRTTLKIFEKKCAEHNVPLNMALGVAGVESGGVHWELDPDKRRKSKKTIGTLVKMGGAGDTGVFQITPDGLHDALSDKSGRPPEKKPDPKILLDLEKNIDIGIRYLRKIYDTYAAKKWSMVPVFYNEGPGGVLKNLLARPDIRKKFAAAVKAGALHPGEKGKFGVRHLRKMIQMGEISVFDLKNIYPMRLAEASEQLGHVLRFGELKKITKSE